MIESSNPRNVTRVVILAVLLLVLVAALSFAAGPASAFTSWQHDSATICGTVGCHGTSHHSNWAPSDADCTSCHSGGFATPRKVYTKYCWDCHTPGQNETPTWKTSAGCTSTCHLAVSPAEEDCDSCHYPAFRPLTFSHGTRPHAGADSAPCTSCHAVSVSATDPGGSPHHGGGLPSTGDCASCHNGTQGSLKVSHATTTCTDCHSGMDIPAVPATCNKCHAAATFGTGTCTASTCHGTSVIHTATPTATRNCTDCHTDKATGHYANLGTCSDCHQNVAQFHHLGGTPPTTDCASCHDGQHASLKVNHDGITNCETCHSGMDIPAVPAKCNTCHTADKFGTGSCTASTCHGTAVIHTATPSTASACTDCHSGKITGHYTGIATCTQCHTDVAGYHHAGAKALPLTPCRGCHDGGIATNKVIHDSSANCEVCHAGMDKPSVPVVCNKCHISDWYGVGTCTASECHGTSQIHTTTPDPPGDCTTCHAAKAIGHYQTLGTCTVCHADVDLYHHHDAKAIPLNDCAACHDGGIASAPPASHAQYGTQCINCHVGMSVPSATDCAGCHNGASASLKVSHATTTCTDCHSGMDRPVVPATCNKCHTTEKFGAGSCTATGCHGTGVIHTATPSAAAACTDCHGDKATGHYTGVASCQKCHVDVAGYHHTGAKTTPLADCGACHDGQIASARTSHAGAVACNFCHNGMDRPVQTTVCRQCHFRSVQVGVTSCTSCHSASGIFGKEQVHSATPGDGVSCTQCHKTHYSDAGACEDCHQRPAVYHHDIGPLSGSTVTAQADASAVVYGSAATLRGRLTSGGAPEAGETLLIQAKAGAGASFEALGSAVTGSDGAWELAVTPAMTTTYRVIWKGGGTSTTAQAPATATAAIGVRPSVGLQRTSPSRVDLGRPVTVAGSVTPASAAIAAGTGGTVKVGVSRARYSRTLHRIVWVRVKSSSPRLDAQARFTWKWTPKARGRYRIVATVAGATDYLPGKSAVRSFRVR